MGRGAAPEQTVDGQLSTKGSRGRDQGCLCRPRGLATFLAARTNRPCVGLFWSHSCTHGIYEDVWCLAPGRSAHQAAALSAGKKLSSGPSAHVSSFPLSKVYIPSSDPLRLPRSRAFCFLFPRLVRVQGCALLCLAPNGLSVLHQSTAGLPLLGGI